MIIIDKEKENLLSNIIKDIKKDPHIIRIDITILAHIERAYKKERLDEISIVQLYIYVKMIDGINDKNMKEPFQEIRKEALKTLIKKIESEDDNDHTPEELYTRLAFLWEVHKKRKLRLAEKGKLRIIGEITEWCELKDRLATKLLVPTLQLKEELSPDEYLKALEDFQNKSINKTPTYTKLKKEIYKLQGEKERKKLKEKKDETKKREKERIAHLNKHPEEQVPCPNCGYKYEIKQEKRNNNGRYGPAFKSWVVEDWRDCRKCKTVFDRNEYPNDHQF